MKLRSAKKAVICSEIIYIRREETMIEVGTLL